MLSSKKLKLKDIVSSTLNSYSIVFFSENKVFAIILLIVSFFDVYAGLSGLAAVIISNGFALILGMRKQNILQGAYGFNSLLVGLGIGIYYQPGIEFYIILFFISLLTLLITLSFEGVLGKYGLPYLSIPFLLGIWFVIIASKGYSALEISERWIYNLNEMYAIGGNTMVKLYEWFNEIAMPEALRIYFKSLSAILFQYHLFAGILIAIGLIYYSRIAFLMSLIGFFSAYLFYQIIGANISEFSYSYIGFNYILTAIAIGGYFIVPNKTSVLWVVLLTPVVAIIMSSTAVLLSHFQLSIFSLPFNIVVLLFLYALKLRENNLKKNIIPVVHQLNSPELHAYTNYSFLKRFGDFPFQSMKLPFWGEWKVTQAYNGEQTHKDQWKYAWDFEIVDDKNSTYEGEGDIQENYYCYNKPVTAPADGIIEEIESTIEDNSIGKVDLINNWGNSVVIKHSEFLHSQLSHLKRESIIVDRGQSVKQGDIIGYVGNSGRSPYPHLHFQFQSKPSIGSETIDHPFSSTIVVSKGLESFNAVSRPLLGDNVSNLVVNKTMQNAFDFIPGSKIKFEVENNGNKFDVSWKIETDMLKNTYLVCTDSGDKAWFNSVDDVFYFTYYSGSKKSLLYYFYLAVFKLALAFYNDMKVKDAYPLNIFPFRLPLLIQDTTIPFFKFLMADYNMVYSNIDSYLNNETIVLNSRATFGIADRVLKSYNFEILITDKGIKEFRIDGNNKVKAVRKS